MARFSIKYGKVFLGPMLAMALILGPLLDLSSLYPSGAQSVEGGIRDLGNGDYRAARLQWESIAADGDAHAMFLLARLYRLGLGVASDMEQAQKLYRLAAERGHPAAKGNLGTSLYFNGNGSTDVEEATRLWEEAAAAGDAQSQYMVAVSYYNGDGLPADPIRGYAWIRLALDQGLKEAATAELEMRREMTIEQLTRGRLLAPTLAKPSSGLDDETRPVLLSELRATRVTDMTDTTQTTATPATPRLPAVSASQTPSRAGSAPPQSSADSERAKPEISTNNDTPPATDAAPRGAVAIESGESITNQPITGWGLQLGAFSRREIAESEWQNMILRFADALASSVVEIIPLERERGTLYRLRARGFISRETANNACEEIKASGGDCFVVAPGPE